MDNTKERTVIVTNITTLVNDSEFKEFLIWNLPGVGHFTVEFIMKNNVFTGQAKVVFSSVGIAD